MYGKLGSFLRGGFRGGLLSWFVSAELVAVGEEWPESLHIICSRALAKGSGQVTPRCLT